MIRSYIDGTKYVGPMFTNFSDCLFNRDSLSVIQFDGSVFEFTLFIFELLLICWHGGRPVTMIVLTID